VQETRSWAAMRAEVEQYCRDKGWYDQPVPFAQAMALLHEEAAEAGHAWRDHGLKDMTGVRGLKMFDPQTGQAVPASGELPKPEGVGSEFADLLIRLLDDDARYRLGLEEYVDSYEGAFDIAGSFMEDVNMLHRLIARASDALETCYADSTAELAGVLVYLRQMAEYYGIDLQAEYQRKMAYNVTRPYRHGGRRA
jgi:NTP pyrophosphatase (non-canonical NTP hydrolase)